MQLYASTWMNPTNIQTVQLHFYKTQKQGNLNYGARVFYCFPMVKCQDYKTESTIKLR